MDGLLTALGAVYPMLAALGAGMLIRRLGMVTDGGLKEMNRLVYKLFFPVMLFVNVMDSDFGAGFSWRLPLIASGFTLAAFLVLMALVPRLESEPARRGVMVQGIFRSNFLVFGLSIVTALYGTDRLAPVTLMAAVVVPLMNGLSVVALEVFRGGRPGGWRIALSVLKNPIVTGTLAAFVCRAVGLDPLPQATRSLAQVGTPFALVVIGASFKMQSTARYRRQLMLCVPAKLVIMPAAAVALGVLLGLRNEALVALMAVAGGPCATASQAMAQQMGGDGELAGLLVVSTSLLCAGTFFLWIYALTTLGLA